MRKWTKVISWVMGAVLVASVVWAGDRWYKDAYGNLKEARSTVLLADGQSSNCMLDISGSTLSVVGSNSSALSVSNPCNIGLKGGTVATFTSPVTVTFGASSDTDGNLFGIGDADWSDSMVMKIGVISNGSTHYFTISRVPYRISGSAATELCQKGDTDCDPEADVMILATGLTLANWVDLPITQVAWVAATYATAGSAWTFSTSAISGATPGFNYDYDGVELDFPAGQIGGLESTYLYVSGGDASGDVPKWTTNQGIYKYAEYHDGTFDIDFTTRSSGARASNGDVGNGLRVVTPFVHRLPTSIDVLTGTYIYNGSVVIGAIESIGQNYLPLTNASTNGFLNANGFANAADDISVHVRGLRRY